MNAGDFDSTVPYDDIGSDDSAKWGNTNDETYYEINHVSVEELPESAVPASSAANSEGILILSGSDESNERTLRNEVRMDQVYRTAADLSLPGTESIPSEVDSLDVGLEREERDNSSGASINSNGSSVRNEDLRKIRGLIGLTAFFAAVAFIAIGVAIAAFRGQSSWKSMASRLEKELTDLQADYSNLVNATKNSGPSLDWSGDSTSTEGRVLVDNCWVKAKANIQLGDCASNAKSCLSNFSARVIDSLDRYGGYVWDTVTETYSMADEPLQLASISFDSLTEASRAFIGGTASFSDLLVASAQKTGEFLDASVLYVVEQTRDAIREASSHTLDLD